MTALAHHEPAGAATAADETQRLYQEHRQRIFAFCLSRLGNRDEADDAVQTTFLYVFRGLERGVTPETELAWLFTIAHNVCRTRRRALGRRRQVEAAVALDTCEHVVAAPERNADELTGLRGALRSLPDTQRNALLLREWQGLSYAEIADTLAVSESAVEALLFRGRRSLAARLREAGDKIAVALNLPVVLRFVQNLLPSGTAGKTAAALAAVAVASSAGGAQSGPQQAAPASPQPAGLLQEPRHREPPAERPRPPVVAAVPTSGVTVPSAAPDRGDDADTAPASASPDPVAPTPATDRTPPVAAPVPPPPLPGAVDAPLPDDAVPPVTSLPEPLAGAVDTVEQVIAEAAEAVSGTATLPPLPATIPLP